VTHLQLVIRLSIHCSAAADAGDWPEASRLMRIRDEEYQKLDAQSAAVFRRWPDMTLDELTIVLRSDLPS
jgi:hypothetical protein